MRDLDKNPYSVDEQRVAQFFFDHGTGGGDDPVGAIIASHQVLAAQLKEVTEERDDLQRTFDFRWKADMRAIKRWQAAHPGNDLVWPDHADMVVWLMDELLRERTRCADIAEAVDSGRGNEKVIAQAIRSGE